MNKEKKFFWHVYPYFFIISLICVVVVVWYTYKSIYSFYLNQVEKQLMYDVNMAASAFKMAKIPLDMKQVDGFCNELGKSGHIRFTVILPNGKVLGDSEKNPKEMDNHGDRPEIRAAIERSFGKSIRYSFTLKKYMMYVAIPIYEKSKLRMVIRAAIPLESIIFVLSRPRYTLLFVSMIILLFVWSISFYITKIITKPIIDIKKHTEEITKGDLTRKIVVSGPEELKSLANSINSMVDTLKAKILEIENAKSQLEAIFSNMVEGVIALDENDKIISINESAKRILHREDNSLEGQQIQRVIRNLEFQEFVEKVRTYFFYEQEINLTKDNNVSIIRARGTLRKDKKTKSQVLVIVLYDITEKKRLESIKKDFVANVSHELKTPITVIKGCIETLEDLDEASYNDVKKFFKIIKRHTSRLESLVNDLLTLARLEKSNRENKIKLKKVNLRKLLESSISMCYALADKKDIKIELNCSPNIEINANYRLMEQAIINLINNAINYSDKGKKIKVFGFKSNDKTKIIVKDQGCGISKEHISRIFERFYRVDKGRSRLLGGTGLGLAIVKHVVKLHRGEILVESEVNRGSTFTIIL